MFLDGHRLQVTPSIGVALIPDHGSTPADLLKRADIALYRAKDSGRNTIQMFHNSMQKILYAVFMHFLFMPERNVQVAAFTTGYCVFAL